MNEIVVGIQLGILIQSLVFAVYIFRNLNSASSKFVLLLLGVLASHMLVNLGSFFYPSYNLQLSSFSFGLIYGPAIYFYVLFATMKGAVWSNNRLFHFLPAIVVVVLNYLGLLNHLVGVSLIFFSLTSYVVASYANYKKFRVTLDATQSEDDSIALKGVKTTLMLNFLVIVFNITAILLSATMHKPSLILLSQIALFVVLSLSVTILALTELTKNIKFLGFSKEDEIIANDGKGQGNSFDLEQSVIVHLTTALPDLMDNEKPYIEPLFNLNSFARKLGIPARKVSAFINQEYGKSFSELTNQYRINAVKNLIQKNPSESILDLAFQCGFSTKSNFNRVFKQHTSLTPSEYKKQIS